jgi:hypothetical protein
MSTRVRYVRVRLSDVRIEPAGPAASASPPRISTALAATSVANVQVGGRLVQEQNSRVLGKSPGDHHQLAFPAAERLDRSAGEGKHPDLA